MVDTQIERTRELVEQLIADTDIFVVDIAISNRKKVEVFLDADSGLPIDACVRINRKLYQQIVETGVFNDGEFSLDVSSPGLDQPLKLPRQYRKNEGRLVQVTSTEGIMEGRMIEVHDDRIVIEQKKKKETKKVEIPFDDIIKTKIQVEFKKI